MQVVYFILIFLAGLGIGILGILSMYSFLLTNGKIPTGLQGTVDFTPEYKENLKRRLDKKVKVINIWKSEVVRIRNKFSNPTKIHK
jgi:hypothetical protein